MREKGLDPAICTIWTADRVLIVPLFIGDYDEKALLKKQLQKLINGVNAHAAIMISEAWLRDLDDPNQKIIGETIVITARNAHEHLLVLQKFSRNGDGTVSFGPVELDIVDGKMSHDTWLVLRSSSKSAIHLVMEVFHGQEVGEI